MRKLMTGIVMIVVMGLVSCSSGTMAPESSDNAQRNVSDGSGQGPSGIWYDGIDDLE